jgi:polysaccharide biosynthesis protein PslH
LKLVVVNARSIYPVNGGDKVFSTSLWGVLEEFAEVTYVVITEEPVKQNYPPDIANRIAAGRVVFLQETFSNSLWNLLRGLRFQWPFFVFRRKNIATISQQLQELLSKEKPDAVVYDHLRSASYFMSTHYKNVLIQHNNESALYAQKKAQLAFPLRAFGQWQVNTVKNFERNIQRKLYKQVFLSGGDIQPYHTSSYALQHIYINTPASSTYQVQPPTPNEPIQLLFVGALDWWPNIEGLNWFLECVAPLMKVPFHLTVVGRNVAHYNVPAGIDNGLVTLVDNAPSIWEYYLNTHLVIVPIISGSGVNIKLLEAAAMGVPIIATGFSLKNMKTLSFLPNTDNCDEFATLLQSNSSFEKRKAIHYNLVAWHQNLLNNSINEWQEIFS